MYIAGWFRQCDLIAYSGDVDIGVWIRDYDDRLIDAMEENGLRLIHSFGKVSHETLMHEPEAHPLIRQG